MDPNATLTLWANAILRGANGNAREHAQDLANWLNRGGFEPAWTAHATRERFYAYCSRSRIWLTGGGY